MTYKECGDCSLCCEGWLIGNAYGNPFHINRPCVFLCNKTCVIYENRPPVCIKYHCGWLQGLFPDWMKPTLSKVIVSIERDTDDNKYLKVIPTEQHIDPEVFEFLDSWTKENNTYYIIGIINGIES